MGNLNKIPFLHLLVYKMLINGAPHKFYISYDGAKTIINRRLNKIPNKYHFLILKEMETFGLFKIHGHINAMKLEFKNHEIEKILREYTSKSNIF